MKRKILVSFLVAILMFALTACGNDTEKVASDKQKIEDTESLLVYSGAGLRKPMDEIGEIYEEKFGVKINYTYAGSAQNLSQIELLKEGDVYIPGSKKYLKTAIEKDLAKEMQDVVLHIPVIAVPKGNPADIKSLNDFTKEGVQVVLGDETSAAIGVVSQKLLDKNGILEDVEKNVVCKDATVNEVLMHTVMKQADASIIWEDNVMGVEEVEAVLIPEDKNIIKTIPIGVLTCSKDKEASQKFVDFVASDEGKAIFEKYGFKRVE